jgi:hypothetical protein
MGVVNYFLNFVERRQYNLCRNVYDCGLFNYASVSQIRCITSNGKINE